MLTLTISDPSALTKAERAALVQLFSDGVEPKTAVEIRVVPPAPAPKPVKALVIDPADNPETGKPDIEIPRFAPGTFALPVETIDPAVVFAKPAATEAAVPSVPVPPAPAAAAASSLPSVPAATAVVPPAGVDLDSRGFPWDHRIHASTKGQNADGAWKKRKNVEAELTTLVEAELRALMSVPVVPPAPGAVPTEIPTTFAMLMDWTTKMVAAHKLTQADVVAAVTPYSLNSVIGLGNRPDLVPQVHEALKARVAEIEANAQAVTP